MEYLAYYFGQTYRRKLLDKFYEQNRHYFKGTVLDIGGRDRGRFRKPKKEVDKWIFADIEAIHNPDIILDVTRMDQFKEEEIDVLLASELFEHVDRAEKGLEECFRVVKKGGVIIISVPFLYPIHADPYDFQRWTEDKWRVILKEIGFKIEKLEVTGRFFTCLMEMKKSFTRSLPFGIRHIGYLLYPIMDIITKLDNLRWVKKHKTLSRFHGGYFIVGRK